MEELEVLQYCFVSSIEAEVLKQIHNLQYLCRVGSVITYDTQLADGRRCMYQGTVDEVHDDHLIVNGQWVLYKELRKINNYNLYKDNTQNWDFWRSLVQ
jgi:hypothetical protein